MDVPSHDARRTLDVLCNKWVLSVLQQLSSGTKRYTELERAIPDVAASMLTRTLQRMERDGLVARTARPDIPPRVEYRLTRLGESLEEPLAALGVWSLQHFEEVEDARRHDDRGRG